MFLRAAAQRSLCAIPMPIRQTVRNFKICVLGGGGNIGQSLSLLYKIDPLVTQLALYDVSKHVMGVAMDLSHINTNTEVTGYTGPDKLIKAMGCSDIVVLTAGVPRTKDMTRDDLFKTNACIVHEVAENFAQYCPEAHFLIVTNPVNSLVPLVAEVLKKKEVYNPNKLYGVTTLDIMRACVFLAEFNHYNTDQVKVHVIGGHSADTMVPIISLSEPKFKGSDEDAKKLTEKIRTAGAEVIVAKDGKGSATLSIAYATYRLTNSLMRALTGGKNIIECAYVDSKVSRAPFFATALELGKEGIAKNLGLPKMNKYEQSLLDASTAEVEKQCKQGIDFANS